jgi:hypothetical protein
MPFIAECTFCQLTLQRVPYRRLGHNMECPRCRNSFTLAAKTAPVAVPAWGPRSARKRRAASCIMATFAFASSPPSWDLSIVSRIRWGNRTASARSALALRRSVR